jgi:hypothetical protein
VSGLVNRDIDGLLFQALDETATDRGVLDQKRGRTIAPLDLHHLAFEGVEGKTAAYHLQNVEDLLAPQQYDTSGIVAGFSFAQGDVPAHDDAVVGLLANVIIWRQPFALDDGQPLESSSLRFSRYWPPNVRFGSKADKWTAAYLPAYWRLILTQLVERLEY